MKKQVLLGSALLAAISVFPQAGKKPKPAGFKMATIVAEKFSANETPANASSTKSQPVMGPAINPDAERSESSSAVSSPPSTISWKLFAGSSNINGALVSQSRPLQYNDALNAVSFVYRKTLSYQPTPAIAATATSGIILANVSTNWGATWDTTNLWSDATNWGRYPQGALYNSPSNNTDIANAYIVGCGPTVAGSTFSGDWYASKKLSAIGSTVGFNHTAPTGASAQFISLQSATFAANQAQHGWSRNGFSATDDGVVRSLALLEDDLQALATVRGVAVVKGTFNAGSFVWTTDTLVPSTLVTSAGAKILRPTLQMAWNKAGTVGYVVELGAVSGATGSNKGYQPIIFKTTNNGVTWTQLPGIDFNSPTLNPLTDHIAPITTNSNVAAPWFSDDIDITVDANNNLHMGATFFSQYSGDTDSLNYLPQYTLSIESGANKYNWRHTPGERPYLYDFIGDGTTAWKAVTVDSMSSEKLGTLTGEDGFNDNPWQPTGSSNSKTCDGDSRIQLGHTPDGQFITFSWAESDTAVTTGSRKYNSIPNIKARCMAIGSGTSMYQVSPTEINVSKVATGTGTNNPNVSNRAFLHYMSPQTGAAIITSAPSTYTVDINTPFVVSNNTALDPIQNVGTYFQGGKLSYAFGGVNTVTTGIQESAKNSASSSVIYPNPAKNNAVLAIDLKNNSDVDVAILNTIGQVVKTTKAQGQIGSNEINLDLNGLSTGIYMVNIKIGSVSSTKKLIVQ